MNNSKIYKIIKRVFTHEELLSADSIQCISYSNLQDWNHISTCYKALQRYPLPSLSINILKDFLFKPAYFAIYELSSPLLIVYRWPNGELRYFLLSSEGYLLEPDEASTWDSSIPFLKYFPGNSKLSGLAVPIVCAPVNVGNWLWYPDNPNYTHFFFDSFVQLAIAQESLGYDYINKFELPVITKPPGWQAELFNLLSSPTYLHPPGYDYQPFRIFRINKLLLPVLSHRSIALDWLRSYLALAFSKAYINERSISKNDELIMVTRYDDRRRRITNIAEIEKLVLNYGGSLIDATGHSISEKLALFQQCKVCIAESSGCINFALFAPETSHLIALTDPSVITKPEFVPGGWVYYTGFANRTSFVVGEDPSPLRGSPVGSSSYSLEAIKELLINYLL